IDFIRENHVAPVSIAEKVKGYVSRRAQRALHATVAKCLPDTGAIGMAEAPFAPRFNRRIAHETGEMMERVGGQFRALCKLPVDEDRRRPTQRLPTVDKISAVPPARQVGQVGDRAGDHLAWALRPRA